MEAHHCRLSRASDPGDDDEAAEIVLDVHRCVMAGLCFGDPGSWESGWRKLAKAAPPEEVGPLFGLFYGFGRALLAAADGSPVFRPNCRAQERLALRVVACAQRSDHGGMLSASSELLDVDDLGGVMQAAQALASALARYRLLVGGPSYEAARQVERPRRPSVAAVWPR